MAGIVVQPGLSPVLSPCGGAANNSPAGSPDWSASLFNRAGCAQVAPGGVHQGNCGADRAESLLRAARRHRHESDVFDLYGHIIARRSGDEPLPG